MYVMKRILFVFIFCLGVIVPAVAQDEELFGKSSLVTKEGFVISMNANFELPGADMAKRFGASYRVGPSVWYKKGNWIGGVKFDFINGSNIREDSLMINIWKDGGLLNQSGVRTDINVYERGYAVGLQAGKLFPISKRSQASTIMLLTTVGFMQHKIKIFDRDKQVSNILGDYNKGYDRLSNGIIVEEFAGFNYFSNDGFLNFYIGLNISAGFTKGRRDYLFDVMRADTENRLDLLFGVRGGLHIPIFKRKSEDIYFK
jgi:hypothetical protein